MRVNSGFSLTELLIAVAVMAVIAGIGGTTYARQLQRGRDQQRIADLKIIQNALERYRADFGQYSPHHPINNPDNNSPAEMIGCDSSVGVHSSAPCGTGAVSGGSIDDTWEQAGIGKSRLLYLVDYGYLEELPIDPLNNHEHYYGFEQTCGNDEDTLCGRTKVQCLNNTCCAYQIAVRLESGTSYRLCDQGFELID